MLTIIQIYSLLHNFCAGFVNSPPKLFLLINVISRSSNSPESGIGNSHLSLGALGEHFQDIDGDDEFYDPEPLPVLGKCKAIYPFEGE